MNTDIQARLDALANGDSNDTEIDGLRDIIADLLSERKDETYNGWTNHATWAVGMYLDGNYDGPGTYYATIETVRHAIEDIEHPTSDYWTEDESRRYNVADALKDLVEEYTIPHTIDDDHPDPQLHPLVSDLFTAALSSVDWNELADAWIESAQESATA